VAEQFRHFDHDAGLADQKLVARSVVHEAEAVGDRALLEELEAAFEGEACVADAVVVHERKLLTALRILRIVHKVVQKSAAELEADVLALELIPANELPFRLLRIGFAGRNRVIERRWRRRRRLLLHASKRAERCRHRQPRGQRIHSPSTC